jgi:hypothetical protein
VTNSVRLSTSLRSCTAPLILIVLGASIASYGLRTAPDRTWPNLLLDGFYFTSLALSAVFFLATQRLTGARWSASLRRIPEAFMMAMPAAAVLMLAISFGREVLYPWTRPGVFANAPAIAGKVRYLQLPWVFVRMMVAFLAWVAFAWLMRKTSLAQDRDPGSSLMLHRRLTRQAVCFVVVFAVTFSMATFDCIISLEPEWFSTMFAVYVFAGTFVQGIAAVTLATVILKERGTFGDAVNENQLHDLGKMLFAFSTFWAYIWTCQYLLIWYGDIPEEATYYVKRTSGPWLILFALNFLVNWMIPFAVLLSVRAKRNTTALKTVSALLLVGHWLDLYVLIMPSMLSTPKIGVLELFIAVGYGALLYLIFVRSLAKAPLVPVNDPILLAEAISSGTFEGSVHAWPQE